MKTDIRNLIERYFEGETNSSEERAIRNFFTNDDIPEDLQMIAPLFRYMEDESVAKNALKEISFEENNKSRHVLPLYKTLRAVGAVAAIALTTIIIVTHQGKQDMPINDSYVWVDGQRITDPDKVREYAEISFQRIKSEDDVMEEQLKFILE